MKLLITLVAGALLQVSPVFADDCAEQLTVLLEQLSQRHQSAGTRSDAQAALDSVPAVCGEAPDTLAAAARIVAELQEPAVRVMSAAHFERTVAEWTGGPVEGVGLTELLSIDIDEQTGLLTVIAPVPGSPAANAGLRAGDVVAAIDGAETEGLGLTGSMQRLRVPAGERVDLRILRDDRVRDEKLPAVELTALEAVAVEQFAVDRGNVLHAHLRQFVPGAAEELRAAMEAAADFDAMVLDLRDNPGGLVDELQRVAGLFLAPGTSIASIDGPQPATLSVAGDAAPIDTPLYVIIGPGSASAAEALAGALQSHGRARVYGERSFGKGLVHETLPMPDGAVAMFPGGQLETPAGRPILGNGIDPDVRTSNPLTTIGSDLSKSLIRRSAER